MNGFDKMNKKLLASQVEDALKDLRAALGNIPILMTFRTSKDAQQSDLLGVPVKIISIFQLV